MSLADLARNVKSAERARRRMKREGVTMRGDKMWTPEEDCVVRAISPDYVAMQHALPHRTYFACRSRARTLDLVTKRPPFTARELSIVRRLYPTSEREDLLSMLPGRRWSQVASFAKRNGIYRAPKPFAPTGVTVLDQIRNRCRELNYTMPDLDKMTKGRGYFAKANWYHGHIHHRAIGRAVKVLFGDLKADWK